MKRSPKPRNQYPPARARSTSRGRKTTALRTRSLNPLRGSARSAKSTAAALEVIDRLVEVLAAEVGPQHVRDPELRVRELPEQEVRDPELPAGADQEIRVGQPVRVQHPREGLLVDRGGRDAVSARLIQNTTNRVHDFRAPAVGERQDQDQPVVPGQEGPPVLQDFPASLGEEIHAPDGAQTDIVLLQLPALVT